MLEKLFKRASWADVAISAVFIVFGLLLVSSPGTIVSMISIILGGIFITIGTFKIIEYLKGGKQDNYLMGLGCAAILAGIVIMFATGIILSIFRIIIGIWIIYTGFMNLQTALVWKDYQSRLWLATVIFSVITLIAGIYVLANSGAILETIGVILIIYGTIDVIEKMIFMKKVDNYMK